MIETMKFYHLFFQLPRGMINSVTDEFEFASQIYARHCSWILYSNSPQKNSNYCMIFVPRPLLSMYHFNISSYILLCCTFKKNSPKHNRIASKFPYQKIINSVFSVAFSTIRGKNNCTKHRFSFNNVKKIYKYTNNFLSITLLSSICTICITIF